MRIFLSVILLFALKSSLFAQQTPDYRSQGNINFDKKNYSAARDYYTKAIDSSKWNKSDLGEIYFKRAECSKFLKEFNEAIKDYNIALNNKPDIKNGYWSRAVAYQNINDFEQSANDYHQAILYADKDNHSLLGLLLNNLSYAEFRLHEIDTAIKYNSAALAQNPNLATAYNNRGSLFQYLKNYPQAIECFSNAIKNIDGSNTQLLSASYLMRANANRLNKNSKAAIKDYTNAIKLDPGNQDAYWNRAASYNTLKDFKSSADDYTRTMSFFQNDKPRLANLYDSRAINKFMQNLFDEAIQDDSVAIALNPDVEQEYINQSLAYNKIGNYRNAIKLNHIALGFQGNNNKQNSFLYTLMAINLYALNEYEDAISSCTKAILLDHENVQAYFRRGEFFLDKMNNKEQAMADFNKVIELDTTKKTHYFIFSLFYTGNSEQAIGTLEKLVSNADNVVAERNEYYDLACLFAIMNKTQDANDHLKIAIDKGYSKKSAMADEYLDNIKNTDDYKSTLNIKDK